LAAGKANRQSFCRLGKPGHIVSPLGVEVVIQEDGRKQAKFERRARSEPLDDLPGGLIFFVGVRPGEVEVELIGVHLGEEIAAAGEGFQIEELVFFEAMNGFDIALVGVSRGRDAPCWLSTRAEGKWPLNSPPLSVCQTRSRSETP
jgi:hypothetical protein